MVAARDGILFYFLILSFGVDVEGIDICAKKPPCEH